MIKYDLIDRTLVITDHYTGKIIWQGKPYGCSIEKAISILDGTGCILLLDPEDFFNSDIRYQGNIVFIDDQGEILWVAEVPNTKDVYVDAKWDGNTLFAYSWGGYRAQIDIGTGKIMNLIFTK